MYVVDVVFGIIIEFEEPWRNHRTLRHAVLDGVDVGPMSLDCLCQPVNVQLEASVRTYISVNCYSGCMLLIPV